MKDYNKVDIGELEQDMITFFHAKAFDLVKYLLTSPELKHHADINTRHDYIFDHACMYGHLDFIKFIFDTPSLGRHSSIQESCIQGLKHCTSKDHLETFQYFETKLKEIKVEVFENIYTSLMYKSCIDGSINIFKYLSQNYLKTNQFNELDYKNFSKAFKKNNLEVITYLIFELNIPKPYNIEEIVEKNPIQNEIIKLFNLRELNQNLKTELSTTDYNKLNKKSKI